MNPASFPPDERRRRGTALCQRLAEDVVAIVPDGIGAWPPAWDLVADADADFLSKLTAWEVAPSEPARLRVRAAYFAVVDAWRNAARQYQAQHDRRKTS